MSPLPTFADGRYEALHPIGAGGSAVVYCVYDKQLEVRRAVKMLDPRLGFGDEVRERVLREARITAKLNHPNVITVHDSFLEDELPCIVMELAHGSLADWVRRHGPLRPDQVFATLSGVLEALELAHNEGVFHRDIKPQNMLIGPTGSVKLADFGIAHHLADSEAFTRTGAVLGSYAYMAPEQRRSAKDAAEPADVYAMAATIAWALTGNSPIDLCVPRARELLLGALPTELVEVIRHATAYDVDERQPTAKGLREALGAVSDGMGASTSPLTPLPLADFSTDSLATAFSKPWKEIDSPQNRPVSSRLAVAGVALGGVLTLGLGALSWPTNSTPSDSGGREWSERALAAAEIIELPDCFPPEYEGSKKNSHPRLSYPRSKIQGPTPREGRDITTADFNGDGIQDVAIYHLYDEVLQLYWGPGFWTVETNNLVAEFTEVPLGRLTKQIGTGDLNGDGFFDVVGIRTESGTSIVVAYGSADPEIWRVEEFSEVGVPGLPLVEDWNGDGISDVVFARQASDYLSLRLGSRDEGLLPAIQIGNGITPHTVGRINDDPWPDIISVSESGSVYHAYRPGGEGMLQTTLLFKAPMAQPWTHVNVGRQNGKTAIYLSGNLVSTLVYTQDASGNWNGCADDRKSGHRIYNHFADLNADGTDEALMVNSCGYCTSNYAVVDYGIRPTN